ncbi:MobV family relaxase [Halomonas sp. AOP5-CZ2-32]
MFVTLRTEGIKRGSHLSTAGEHNHRTSKEPDSRVDPERTHLNQHLVKTAETVPEAVQKRISEAGVKLPKNANVVAQELVLGASPEYFRPSYHPEDPNGKGKYEPERLEAWKEKTMNWLKDRFGEKNIVDAVLHLDETTPHIHAMVLPIAEVELKHRRTNAQKEAGEPNTTYMKTKWNRSQVFGLAQHYEMQDEYADALSSLGLHRGISKKLTKKQHKTVKDYHREQWELLNSEIVYPNTDFKMDTDIESSFTMPKPKTFESAKKYAERCEGDIREIIKNGIADDYEFKVKEFEKAFDKAKDFTASLANEAKEQMEKNHILTNALKQITKAIENPELVRKILEQQDPEKKLDRETNIISNTVKVRKKAPKNTNSPSLQ